MGRIFYVYRRGCGISDVNARRFRALQHESSGFAVATLVFRVGLSDATLPRPLGACLFGCVGPCGHAPRLLCESAITFPVQPRLGENQQFALKVCQLEFQVLIAKASRVHAQRTSSVEQCC